MCQTHCCSGAGVTVFIITLTCDFIWPNILPRSPWLTVGPRHVTGWFCKNITVILLKEQLTNQRKRFPEPSNLSVTMLQMQCCVTYQWWAFYPQYSTSHCQLTLPCFRHFNLPLFVCVFQGWVMAVRWLFYTPVSITLWYWPGRFSISSSLLTPNFPGRVAETAGTQVCYPTKRTSIKRSTCPDSGAHAMLSCCKHFTLQTTSQGAQIRLGHHFKSRILQHYALKPRDSHVYVRVYDLYICMRMFNDFNLFLLL